jgi:hypothetical protein
MPSCAGKHSVSAPTDSAATGGAVVSSDSVASITELDVLDSVCSDSVNGLEELDVVASDAVAELDPPDAVCSGVDWAQDATENRAATPSANVARDLMDAVCTAIVRGT